MVWIVVHYDTISSPVDGCCHGGRGWENSDNKKNNNKSDQYSLHARVLINDTRYGYVCRPGVAVQFFCSALTAMIETELFLYITNSYLLLVISTIYIYYRCLSKTKKIKMVPKICLWFMIPIEKLMILIQKKQPQHSIQAAALLLWLCVWQLCINNNVIWKYRKNRKYLVVF